MSKTRQKHQAMWKQKKFSDFVSSKTASDQALEFINEKGLKPGQFQISEAFNFNHFTSGKSGYATVFYFVDESEKNPKRSNLTSFCKPFPVS